MTQFEKFMAFATAIGLILQGIQVLKVERVEVPSQVILVVNEYKVVDGTGWER